MPDPQKSVNKLLIHVTHWEVGGRRRANGGKQGVHIKWATVEKEAGPQTKLEVSIEAIVLYQNYYRRLELLAVPTYPSWVNPSETAGGRL